MTKKKWTCPDWPELIAAVETWKVDDTIYDAPQRYRKAVALALAVAKWHPDRGNSRGTNVCALCVVDRSSFFDDCRPCALAKADRACHLPGSLFQKARAEMDGAPDLVGSMDALYNVLVGLYREEYERVCGGDA